MLDNFRRWTTRFRILAADFPFPACNLTEGRTVRLGQVPQWLDLNQSAWRDGDVSLEMIQHAEFMSDYRQTTFSRLVDEGCAIGPCPNRISIAYVQFKHRVAVCESQFERGIVSALELLDNALLKWRMWRSIYMVRMNGCWFWTG